jgi:hypothetical protein
MTRLLAAALLLALAATPALACGPDMSAATDSGSSTVAARPAGDQGTPPPAPPADQRPG